MTGSACQRASVGAFAAALAAVVVLFLGSAPVHGHPEDEFCVPGQEGIDPGLCRALLELNSADGGTELGPLLDDAGNERSAWSTFGLYIGIGVDHILPDGLDHILFVLALFLASTRLRALVIQISTFTVAHTVTLGLAAAGVIVPVPAIVEPLIAFTIAFVAIENLVFSDMTRWRPLLVFAFGLVHGLGFAGFFGELGLPPGQFWSALIGFNLGVEIGQLSVVAAAFVMALLIRRRLDERAYRRYAVLPASAAIGLVGLWWGVQRIATQLV